MQRAVSKKSQVSHITKGKYFGGGKSAYVITPLGEKLSRVNIIATITDKFVSENGNYSSVTIDDGTDAIRVKAFKENVKKLGGLKKGDLVVVIGTVSEYHNEIYVNAEVVKQVEPKYKALRSLELLEHINERKIILDRLGKLKKRLNEEELKEYGRKIGIEEEAFEIIFENKGPDHRLKVLEAISNLDDGNGADIGKIFESLDLPDSVVENVMDELLAEGYLYEPSVGKYKRI